MDNRPIGIFDSGVGGLTVLREIIKVVPNENTIYFGDTERVPYGSRDLSEVRKFAINITRFLHEKNVKLIVIACNTSTAAALDEIRKEYDIPIIGVIGPGARTAVFNTINKRVGVIATLGTVKSKAYEDEIKKIDPEIRTFSTPAPLLVEYVEKGILEGIDLSKAINNYLDPLARENIDVLILGCTHFPLIEKRIAAHCNNMKVISSAVETAKDVKKILAGNNINADKDNKPERIFYETALSSNFYKVGKMFLGEEIREVIKVRLDI